MTLHRPEHPVRVVTAASLFDGHDAAITIIRRLLQAQGAEVIHLGHNRSVDDVATAAIQEDAAAVAVSSYQGGHVEYFSYLADRLESVRIYGGGGGVIAPDEIRLLAERGVTIFSPEDGQRMGLDAMVNTIIADCDRPPVVDDIRLDELRDLDGLDSVERDRHVARVLTAVENGARWPPGPADAPGSPVLGITGTGGSGKSSLTDELLARFGHRNIAVLAVDPNRRSTGGALLGDRIRVNTPVFFRSIGTRGSASEIPAVLSSMVEVCRTVFDLVIVETPGIGQGDAAIGDVADVSLYVMTPEFGAASQLEKIDMFDVADVVAINKFDRRGAEDARRDVARQLARLGRDVPVFGTVASRFNDAGTTELYEHLRGLLGVGRPAPPGGVGEPVVPERRVRYLADIVDAVESYHAATAAQVAAMRDDEAVCRSRDLLIDAGDDGATLDELRAATAARVDADSRRLVEQHRLDVADLPARVDRLLPKVAVPRVESEAELLRWLRSENLPGRFPFTAGVFPSKRDDEDPTRMFAGEGGPERTNARFHLLAKGQPATRLSTAFDSVTLYGADPDRRPDIYGKIGNSGVSVATLDDMKDLFAGFDLCDSSTSVSMTINGPAPAILAMYLNTAIDQHPELGSAEVLRRVRGTVQADILKEDQGQNTCLFSIDFALRMMADIQEWFVRHEVRRFYSVSISGYHIAEAGANPITQLAFTLANGFTYVEAYLARGMAIDDFAPNLSFFFSNGMDPEYTVLGRVARRIWAIAMRDRYGADERSQKLKYHIQTSGRSLHAQEIDFNDIRTTLQALCAIYDNANSLHTNAYDEALTTPTDESVRRALAIQLIINHEWGLAKCDNPLQGSFVVEELTDLVEAEVLAEMERLNRRGGVLGAMETGYQRGRIQDESMAYEMAKHDGTLPIIGVNRFVVPKERPAVELRRSDTAEKDRQIERVESFRERHAADRDAGLALLVDAALNGSNTFEAMMTAVRSCTLGEITDALFEVGGRYRRGA